MFKKAERKQAKLRLALSGPSGSGKTTGALLIAKGIGGKIAVLDTERGSASLYADLVDFDVVELSPPYTPERYIEIIHAAEKEGYTTLILDSITHEWNGQGGILEIVDKVAKTKFKGNSYAAWNEGTPRHQKFIDTMLASSLHIIATMRSKAVYVETEKGNGKKSIEKQGSSPQQREGLEYEFTAVLDIFVDGHLALASKDRTRLFKEPLVITEDVGVNLLKWLQDGVEYHDQTPPQQKRLYPDSVDFEGVTVDVMSMNSREELEAYWKTVGVPENHKDYSRIAKIFSDRMQAIKGIIPLSELKLNKLDEDYNCGDRDAQ